MRRSIALIAVLAVVAAIIAIVPSGEPPRPTPAVLPPAAEPAFHRAAEATGADPPYTLPPDRTRRGNAYRPHPDATPDASRAQRWEAGLAYFRHERR